MTQTQSTYPSEMLMLLGLSFIEVRASTERGHGVEALHLIVPEIFKITLTSQKFNETQHHYSSFQSQCYSQNKNAGLLTSKHNISCLLTAYHSGSTQVSSKIYQ